eukprot:COSAG04_NODE_4454_length_2083_cov_1.026714_1_plen_243_part_00
MLRMVGAMPAWARRAAMTITSSGAPTFIANVATGGVMLGVATTYGFMTYEPVSCMPRGGSRGAAAAQPSGRTAAEAIPTEVRGLNLVDDAEMASDAIVEAGLKRFKGERGFGSAERIGTDMKLSIAQQLVSVGHTEWAADTGAWSQPIDLGELRITADLVFFDHDKKKYFKLTGQVRRPEPVPFAESWTQLTAPRLARCSTPCIACTPCSASPPCVRVRPVARSSVKHGAHAFGAVVRAHRC